jgi:hypothetical protein
MKKIAMVKEFFSKRILSRIILSRIILLGTSMELLWNFYGTIK